MTVEITKRHQASAHVMITVHTAEQARYYYDQNNDQMFSVFIRTMEEFQPFEEEGVPWSQIMAYVGSLGKPENLKALGCVPWERRESNGLCRSLL